MKRLKQSVRHCPAEGRWGDCHRAAVASALDLALDDVPHFGDGGADAGLFRQREVEWFEAQGLTPLQVPFQGDLEGILQTVGSLNPGVCYLLGGNSKIGAGHTVVCVGAEIVHDPSPDENGIVGPMSDGLYWVTFFGSGRAAHSEAGIAPGVPS